MAEVPQATQQLVGSPSDLVPRPDPTVLTTQAFVDRAVSTFRELMETRLDALALATTLAEGKIERMSDRAVEQRETMHVEIEKAAFSLRELMETKLQVVLATMDEKFEGIDRRFSERDVRTEQAAQESRISLDAALAAAKEAVSEQNNANSKAILKSEEATQKQIDALAELTRTSNRSLEDKINDLKGRLDRGEGETRGTEFVRKGEHQAGMDSRALVFSIIGVIIAVAVIAVAIANLTGT